MNLDSVLNRVHNIYSFHPSTSIPSLTDKVILVTGGNTGLGLHTVLQLAQHGPKKIYLTARSRLKFDAALASIQEQVSNADQIISFLELDLSSLTSVRHAAEQVLSSTSRLDLLINNAGVMGAAPSLTPEGYEIHFGTNHMGHALLTRLLLPLLTQTAATTTDARIVNVSSGAHQLADPATVFDPTQLKSDMSSTSMMTRYAQSKLANILHARSLAARHPTLTVTAIAPGRVATGLLDALYSSGRERAYVWFQRFYDWAVGTIGVSEGAWTQVWAATEPDRTRVASGAFYSPVGRLDAGTPLSRDDELAEKLWEWTEKELDAFLK